MAYSNRRPGDWDCACGAMNFASRNVCFKCNMPKEGGGGGFGEGGDYGYGAPAPAYGGGNPNRRPGDWDCPSCGSLVFASRDSCFKCHTPRSQAGGFGEDGFSQGGFSEQRQFGAFGGYGGGAGGGGGGGNRRPGDWDCPNCQSLCFGSKNSCFRCGTARPVDDFNNSFAPPPPRGGGGNPDRRPGDWDCPNCATLCYASRTECFRCHTLKPADDGFAPRGGYRDDFGPPGGDYQSHGRY